MTTRIAAGETCRIKLGGETTTDEIMQEWREAGFGANNCITQARFPLTSHGPKDVEIRFIQPDRSFGEKAGLAMLSSAGLERPTYEHALRFVEQYGKTTTGAGPYIIFLHKPWFDFIGSKHRVLCISRPRWDRVITLDGMFFNFSDLCILAGVCLDT